VEPNPLTYVRPSCRLYLITPSQISDLAQFEKSLREVIEAGNVASLQLRLKGVSDEVVLETGRVLFPMAQELGVACLVNDRPDLAQQCGADGSHIGQSDAPYRDARARMGRDGIVGVTCHDSRHLAMEAAEAGADYVAFGAFFETATKTPLSRAEPELLTWWQDIMEIPCVAIGGITVDNGEELIRAGADFLAVSGGIWHSPLGPRAASAQFAELFEKCA
jgi:thiamine-phosphate pyrophosphorylase